MNRTLYILVVDQAWARLYKAANPPEQLALVYHQALFGGRPLDSSADDELARSLCRLLRADRQTGKYLQIVMLASDGMLSALHRQYDGDWRDVVPGDIARLPARYTDEDLAEHARHLLARDAALTSAATNWAAEGTNITKV